MLLYTMLMAGYCILCTQHHITALPVEQQVITAGGALDVNDDWNMTVDERSINYFRSRLQIVAPNFIRFRVAFCGDCRSNGSYPGYTTETFDPYQWVWTYKSGRGLYPYTHWNMDYNILSFGLLDTKTLWNNPYILFKVKGNCSDITLGTNITTHRLAEQLTVLVSHLSEDNKTITRYQESYFCYLAEVPGFRNSLWYHIGIYLDYPTSSINYNCCKTFYDYVKSKYSYVCWDKQMKKWTICTTGPYFLGIILFLCFPISLLKTTAWLTKHDHVKSEKSGEPHENTPLIGSQKGSQYGQWKEADWLFLDGNAPKSFVDLFASKFSDNHPVLMSRLQRLLFVLLGPSIVFIRIWVYHNQALEFTQKLIARGVSVGFLVLLGELNTFQRNTFVISLASYFVLGVLFLVIPRSIQNVIQNGIPRVGSSLSPLCMAAKDIRHLSQIHASDKPGYKNATNLFLCSFYMLFTVDFWKTLFDIQKTRFVEALCLQSGSKSKWCICLIILPLYIMACFLEVVVCIVYYTTPLCVLIVVLVRGAVKTITSAVCNSRRSTERNKFSKLLNNTFVLGIVSFVVAAMFIFYVYTFCLVFIESFFFISQILIFCYIAVLVYPVVAFGYLFFGIALLYYIFRLIRGFGAKYLELLSDIVEVCMQMEEQDNCFQVYDGKLIISTAKITRLQGIQINDITVPVAQSIIQRIEESKMNQSLLRLKNNTYGIRKELFNYAVRKHLPVHQQVLRVVFHLALILIFLLQTSNLTARFVTSTTSEISNVMHVVFVITVGALPRVLEVALTDNSEHIHRAIRMRKI